MNELRDVEAQLIPLDSLKAYDGNAKQHDNENIDAIANSISEFGFRNPILAWHNEDGVPEIVAGHGRAAAAKKLRMEQVPVIFVDDLTDAQRRMLTLADNQTTMMTGWDADTLDAELDSLRSLFAVENFGFGFYEDDVEEKYTDLVKGLIYEPTEGCAPSVLMLADTADADALKEKLSSYDGLTDDERDYLELAAQRFVKFDYEAAADYYASASPQMQEAMEAAKLVIVDTGATVENAAKDFVQRIEGTWETS